MNLSLWCRSLLAALICVAPIGAAVAQDQHDRDDQAPNAQHPQPSPQHAQPQSHLPQAPAHPNATPQVQHPGQGATPQMQHPVQNGAPRTTQDRPQPSVQRAAPAVHAAPQQPAAHGNFQGNAAPSHAAPAPSAAFASHHGGAAPTQFSHGQFYGHDYAHFTPHDQALWHGGAWHHEYHDGRFGWWYAVDGIWYFYDEPVYPYPTYIPDIVYIPDVVEVAPPPPPEVEAPPPPAAASYYYYFCPDTQTYYPYVTSCASPWQPVSPVPPQ